MCWAGEVGSCRPSSSACASTAPCIVSMVIGRYFSSALLCLCVRETTLPSSVLLLIQQLDAAGVSNYVTDCSFVLDALDYAPDDDACIDLPWWLYICNSTSIHSFEAPHLTCSEDF